MTGLMEQFDDIFRENVRKAFSNYNADHLADEGWNSFLRQKRGRKRFVAMIPFWARAAAVLLLIGLGGLITYRISTRQNVQEIISGTETALNTVEEQPARIETSKAETPLVEPAAESVRNQRPAVKRIEEGRQSFTEQVLLSEADLQEDNRIISDGTPENRPLKPYIVPVISVAEAVDELFKEIIPEDLITASLISEDLLPEKMTPGPEKPSRESMLMAGMSGLIAQSEGTTSPASGLSMGFFLDQELTRKISVRPGLALTVQSIGLENGRSHPISADLTPLSDGTSGVPYSYDGQLSMVTLELPLNIVFRIIEGDRSGFYVSAGASSMIYMNQNLKADIVNAYTKQSYSTATGMYSSETHYSTVEVEKNYSAFSRTDFFGLANLSAGYSFPYSKTGTMLIEPFVQLPVNDLTSLNLKIRYAGVSMKLRFGNQEQER